jgi:catechol 2,3-dioxygenase-like lactoylglutathione lyase family enzyme
MDIGFSAAHGPSDIEKVLWTLEQVQSIDYFRFELCNGRGVDRYIPYPVLPRLNAFKRPHGPEAAGLRRIMGRAREQGRQTALWVHDLIAPRELLDVYPELRTPHGDVNVTHPLLAEFVTAKYDAFFTAFPEVDAVTLTMTEVIFPVAHRFDCPWTPDECIGWLIGLVHAACRRHKRTLIVRPFSAIRADYEATRKALARLPDDIEIMDKSDPFDWDPHLPINPELATWPAERLTVEFDLLGEYFGRGTLPVIYPDYLRARIDHARALGVRRLVGRLDRWGRSALDREARLNVRFFHAYAKDPAIDREELLACAAASCYRTRDPDRLVQALCDGFEVVRKLFYTDGHLLFHETFTALRQAQNGVLFETLRPGQPLDHCREEWHILSDRVTPSVADARREKDEALALARDVLARIKDLAPDEPQLRAHAEDMVLLARLFRAALAAAQEYLLHVRDAGQAPTPFHDACDALDAVLADIRATRADNWLTNIPRVASAFTAELRAAFPLERAVYQDLPGLSPQERARVEDVLAAGYPAEGHRISKYTHGAAAQFDGRHFWRTVSRHLAYTLACTRGPRRLRFEAAGIGRLTLSAGGVLLHSSEWTGGDPWSLRSVDFTAPGTSVDMRIDRIAAEQPEIGLVYLLRAAPTSPGD